MVLLFIYIDVYKTLQQLYAKTVKLIAYYMLSWQKLIYFQLLEFIYTHVAWNRLKYSLNTDNEMSYIILAEIFQKFTLDLYKSFSFYCT